MRNISSGRRVSLSCRGKRRKGIDETNRSWIYDNDRISADVYIFISQNYPRIPAIPLNRSFFSQFGEDFTRKIIGRTIFAYHFLIKRPFYQESHRPRNIILLSGFFLLKLSSLREAHYLQSLGNCRCLEDTISRRGKNSFSTRWICGGEKGYSFGTKRGNRHERVECYGFSIRMCVQACERVSERSCVHECVCTSVCSADVKADPGLRVQAAAASLLALTPCKIPVAVSFFVTFEQHRRESLGERAAPVRRSRETWRSAGGR